MINIGKIAPIFVVFMFSCLGLANAQTREITKNYTIEAFLERGANYQGNDILLISTNNAADCMAACFSVQECAVFTYDPDNNRCFLKHSHGNKSTGNPNLISGRKSRYTSDQY